jgi:hypothetical protein
MPLKRCGIPGCSNFVEFRPKTTYRPVCNVWGLSGPLQTKILKESFEKYYRIKLALCKLAYEIYQSYIM